VSRYSFLRRQPFFDPKAAIHPPLQRGGLLSVSSIKRHTRLKS
jgi:hypothetical protein